MLASAVSSSTATSTSLAAVCLGGPSRHRRTTTTNAGVGLRCHNFRHGNTRSSRSEPAPYVERTPFAAVLTPPPLPHPPIFAFHLPVWPPVEPGHAAVTSGGCAVM